MSVRVCAANIPSRGCGMGSDSRRTQRAPMPSAAAVTGEVRHAKRIRVRTYLLTGGSALGTRIAIEPFLNARIAEHEVDECGERLHEEHGDTIDCRNYLLALRPSNRSDDRIGNDFRSRSEE